MNLAPNVFTVMLQAGEPEILGPVLLQLRSLLELTHPQALHENSPGQALKERKSKYYHKSYANRAK